MNDKSSSSAASATLKVAYISSSIWLLAIGSPDLSQAEKKVTEQNDNYFHSKWSKVVILSKDSRHFLNLLSFGGTFFLLSLREIT